MDNQTKLERALMVLKQRRSEQPGLGIIVRLLEEHKAEMDAGQSIVYHGHVVHVTDADSGDEFNVEVLMHERLTGVDLVNKAEAAALKTDMATLSGNTMSAEYVQPSGMILKTTKIRQLIQETNQGSADILGHFTMD